MLWYLALTRTYLWSKTLCAVPRDVPINGPVWDVAVSEVLGFIVARGRWQGNR